MKHTKYTYYIYLILLLFTQSLWGQSDTQQKLEKRRENLQKEIAQINKRLSNTRQDELGALNVYNELKRKIYIRQKLIRNLQKEINHINYLIKKNQKKTQELNQELKELKADYARMIRQSYNSRSRNDKLYFLFSSESFQQAFKRMQYLKQYAKYRKKQAGIIEAKKKELIALKEKLEKDKQAKQKLYADYKKEEKIIRQEKEKQQKIVEQIKKEKNKYLAQIKAKQREQARIDKLIDDMIKKAIRQSNKKVAKNRKKTGKFFLTPEGKKLANDFSKNKGYLPWPVKKAYISRKFGVQPHEIFKNVKVTNAGIYLATEPGSKARAVFDGKVLQIQVIPGGNNTVFIKHGNYLTIYGNLKEVYVQPGQRVKMKQEIGKIATGPNGKTELKFRIYKNTTKLNPELWLMKK